jgi:hypothetical protein
MADFVIRKVKFSGSIARQYLAGYEVNKLITHKLINRIVDTGKSLSAF